MFRYWLTVLIFFMIVFQSGAQGLEFNYKQIYLSPFASFGSPAIIRQNNYGYSTMAYQATPGFQTGVYFGRDRNVKRSFKTGVILSFWGQYYRDTFSGKKVEKTINNRYLQIPLIYKYVLNRKIRDDYHIGLTYLQGGLMIGYLVGSSVQYFREANPGLMVEETVVDFVTNGGWNQNTEAILSMGDPDHSRDLFSPFDINVEISYGYQKFISRRTAIWVEVHGVLGLTDINASSWRLKNNYGAYFGSFNAYPGIKVGANIYLF